MVFSGRSPAGLALGTRKSAGAEMGDSRVGLRKPKPCPMRPDRGGGAKGEGGDCHRQFWKPAATRDISRPGEKRRPANPAGKADPGIPNRTGPPELVLFY